MTIYQFMSDSPVLTGFIIFWLVILFIALANMLIKSVNIYKHGYPPLHCDAYGDGIGFEKEIDLEVN